MDRSYALYLRALLTGVAGSLCLMAATVIGVMQYAGALGWSLVSAGFWIIVFAATGIVGFVLSDRIRARLCDEIGDHDQDP